jgi:adenylate cyclase
LEALGAIFTWIGSNEAVLSGIAASIVILGVAYRPVRRLLPGGRPARPPAAAAGPGEPDRPALVTSRPSIAVVPFANLSTDPEQAFLADGLTEDVILGLSRVKQLFVIARNTSFTYRGRTVDAGVVSRELGVRYVLEGSVRRTGDRIRVTAQLVDATTRRSVWSDHFDRKVEQITQVDDEVTEAILAALLPALRRAEVEHARRTAPEDLTAWALVNRAWVRVQSDLGDQAALDAAVEACREALAREPDYAFAHAVLALALSLTERDQVDEATRAEAEAAIQRALALAPDDPLVHHCQAALHGNFGRTRDGIRAWQRAIDLDPNSAGARAGLGISLIYTREHEEALAHIDAALRRSPRDPIAYHWLGNRALALAMLGRSREAEDAARASIAQRPSRIALAILAAVVAERGDIDEAARVWRELVTREPRYAPEQIARLAASLAPDPERARTIEQSLLRAARAASAGGTAPSVG